MTCLVNAQSPSEFFRTHKTQYIRILPFSVFLILNLLKSFQSKPLQKKHFAMVYSMARGSFWQDTNAYICLWEELNRQNDKQHERTLQNRILPPLILMKIGDNFRTSLSSCHSDKLSLNHCFYRRAKQISHKKIKAWSRKAAARFPLWSSRVLLSHSTMSCISWTVLMDQ